MQNEIKTSTTQAFGIEYDRNRADKAEQKGLTPCCRCGRAIKTDGFYVFLDTSNRAIAPDQIRAVEASGRDWMGMHPIGSECCKAFKGFVVDAEGKAI
jgi:hypothetical protein